MNDDKIVNDLDMHRTRNWNTKGLSLDYNLSCELIQHNLFFWRVNMHTK
jgi:hypothetical protein